MTDRFQPPDHQEPYAPQRRPTSAAAVLGLVFAFLFFPIGLVASLIGLRHTGPARKRGRGLAVAGLVISGLATLFWVVVIAVVVAGGGPSSKPSSASAPVTPAPAPSAATTSTPPASAAPSTAAATTAPSTAPPTSRAATGQAPTAAATTKAPAPAAPAVTAGQTQALRSAEEYLDYQAFSYRGLIAQLDSPYGGQFSVPDATYAADRCGADWNAQAARAAKEYLKTQAFSHAALVQQLDSPYGGQFTPQQAEYGASQAGV